LNYGFQADLKIYIAYGCHTDFCDRGEAPIKCHQPEWLAAQATLANTLPASVSAKNTFEML
jgi:hypothetical protein